jgi:hypothetical protein
MFGKNIFAVRGQARWMYIKAIMASKLDIS